VSCATTAERLQSAIHRQKNLALYTPYSSLGDRRLLFWKISDLKLWLPHQAAKLSVVLALHACKLQRHAFTNGSASLKIAHAGNRDAHRRHFRGEGRGLRPPHFLEWGTDPSFYKYTPAWFPHFFQIKVMPLGMRESLCVKTFKQNVFRLQTSERFVRGSDAAFCQITFTTCYDFQVSALYDTLLTRYVFRHYEWQKSVKHFRLLHLVHVNTTHLNEKVTRRFCYHYVRFEENLSSRCVCDKSVTVYKWSYSLNTSVIIATRANSVGITNSD